MTAGIYIHFPFCRKKCDYCNFFSLPLSESSVPVSDYINSYVKALIRESGERLPALKKYTADTIYFGGGTPSVLSPKQVSEVLNSIKNAVHVAKNAEISIEINPCDVASEKLLQYRDGGVNRFILGVQTLNEKLHRTIGRSNRLCSTDDLETFFALEGVVKCVDIITGIPGQDDDALRNDLRIITAFNPHHISAYLLSIERGTPLAETQIPDEKYESKQKKLFYKTIQYLKEKGYCHYEISNYSKKGFQSRHNMKYWKFMPYVGLGPGSHSFIEGERYINNMSVDNYIKQDKTRLIKDARCENSSVVEFIMTAMRLLQGFNVNYFENILNIPFPEIIMDRIEKEAEKGYVIIDKVKEGILVRLSEKHLHISDTIIYNIVEPLI